MLAHGFINQSANLPDYYADVNHLREECNEVLDGVKRLEDTNLKDYIKTSEDITEFACMLYDHIYQNMHSTSFFTRSKK